MAADSLTIWQGGADAKPLQGVHATAEPKVAVCGRVLLCGMAGFNPIHYTDGSVKIEYDFQSWISSIGSNKESSPRQFAKAIQIQSRYTFRNIGTVMQVDPFGRSKAALHMFLAFQVAGYALDTPQICDVRITVDRNNDRLNFPEPDCVIPQIVSPSPTSIRFSPLSLGSDIVEALKSGTPQHHRFLEIQPVSNAAAVTLLSDSPPTLQVIVGAAASGIRLTDELNPDKAGGVTTIGVIWKGRRPTVFQFPNF